MKNKPPVESALLHTTLILGGTPLPDISELPKAVAVPRPTGLSGIVRENARQIGLCMLVTFALTVLSAALLPALSHFWARSLVMLLDWLGLDYHLALTHRWIPYLVGPTAPPPQLDDFGWHMVGALVFMAVARLALRPPFRTPLVALGLFHLLNTVAIVGFPGLYPYSVSAHTRWLSLFTVGFILILPTIMAFSHAIIERSQERRIIATLLISAYFILSLPIKLLVHAALIQMLSSLIIPTLFLVLGPAFDICLFTALYAIVVAWRHHPAGAD